MVRWLERRGLRATFATTATLLACQAAGSTDAGAQELPQYGGTLSVGTVSITNSPLSWDPADWNYKSAEDIGYYYSRLFVGDLRKSKARGGPYAFKSDAYLPADAIRGDLAESWRWLENPLRLDIELRKGVMFPDKPGVMTSRELTAQDVVYSYSRLLASAKRTADYIDHIEKIEALSRYKVVIYYKHFHEDWGQRLGWGTYSSVYPKEVVDAGISDWRKANGSGPFVLTNYVNGNSQTYERNPIYFGKDSYAGKDYRLPFVDRLVVRIIKDESAQHAALRTGKLDLLQSISWSVVDELKRSAPKLKWSRWLAHSGRYLSMRMDTKPFDDIRVRRAMNMAVNKQEIVSSYYGGNAAVFAYPQHPDYAGTFEPLESMPESIRELYRYDPDKAKQLLAEAGYPNGFSIKVQVCTCTLDMMDLGPLVAGYLARVGIKLEFELLEQAPFFSLLRAGKNAPGMFFANSHGGPSTTLRKNFMPNQYSNSSHWSDPAFEEKMQAVYRERNEAARTKMLRELTREVLEKAPYVWLPTPYIYSAWWPWVKNYEGEIYAGGFWYGPVFENVWIDQVLKKKLGF
ncbi:MAG: ABC transporter substrate-binding protein [Burkholderiales bacterium]